MLRLSSGRKISSFQIIICGFLAIILVGAMLLMMPTFCMSYGINIMAVREYGQMDLTVTPDTVLERNKTLLVLGKRKAIQKCFRM